MNGSLWIALLVPAIFIPIVYFLGRKIGKNVCWIAFIPLLFSSIFFASFLPKSDALPISDYFYWIAEIRFGLLKESLSLPGEQTAELTILIGLM